MKIITFWGGLGNQMFEYAYYRWLQEKFPKEKFYAYYPNIGLSAHNGLEINKRFDVELPPTSILTTVISNILFNVNRVCRRLRLPVIATCTQQNGNYNAVFHCDYWQNKKYISDSFNLKPLKTNNLDIKNWNILKMANDDNVVAVHIRRGDYLKAENTTTYGGICTEQYYSLAMNYIEERIGNPRYIIFSDDPQYVKKHYTGKNTIIVDWNIGENSFYDMYLMSQCKNMILANSTFSYWAARLNKKSGIICCPTKWTNVNEPDIILDHWNKIEI